VALFVADKAHDILGAGISVAAGIFEVVIVPPAVEIASSVSVPWPVPIPVPIGITILVSVELTVPVAVPIAIPVSTSVAVSIAIRVDVPVLALVLLFRLGPAIAPTLNTYFDLPTLQFFAS
jgi:hypothetical protein